MTDAIPRIEELPNLRLVDLKEVCKNHSIKVSGTKGELITRITDYIKKVHSSEIASKAAEDDVAGAANLSDTVAENKAKNENVVPEASAAMEETSSTGPALVKVADAACASLKDAGACAIETVPPSVEPVALAADRVDDIHAAATPLVGASVSDRTETVEAELRPSVPELGNEASPTRTTLETSSPKPQIEGELAEHVSVVEKHENNAPSAPTTLLADNSLDTRTEQTKTELSSVALESSADATQSRAVLDGSSPSDQAQGESTGKISHAEQHSSQAHSAAIAPQGDTNLGHLSDDPQTEARPAAAALKNRAAAEERISTLREKLHKARDKASGRTAGDVEPVATPTAATSPRQTAASEQAGAATRSRSPPERLRAWGRTADGKSPERLRAWGRDADKATSKEEVLRQLREADLQGELQVLSGSQEKLERGQRRGDAERADGSSKETRDGSGGKSSRRSEASKAVASNGKAAKAAAGLEAPASEAAPPTKRARNSLFFTGPVVKAPTKTKVEEKKEAGTEEHKSRVETQAATPKESVSAASGPRPAPEVLFRKEHVAKADVTSDKPQTSECQPPFCSKEGDAAVAAGSSASASSSAPAFDLADQDKAPVQRNVRGRGTARFGAKEEEKTLRAVAVEKRSSGGFDDALDHLRPPPPMPFPVRRRSRSPRLRSRSKRRSRSTKSESRGRQRREADKRRLKDRSRSRSRNRSRKRSSRRRSRSRSRGRKKESRRSRSRRSRSRRSRSRRRAARSSSSSARGKRKSKATAGFSSATEQPVSEFQPYSRVRLCNLVKNQDLNGLAGTVLPEAASSTDTVAGCIKVKLESGREVAVKPGNLALTATNAQTPEGQGFQTEGQGGVLPPPPALAPGLVPPPAPAPFPPPMPASMAAAAPQAIAGVAGSFVRAGTGSGVLPVGPVAAPQGLVVPPLMHPPPALMPGMAPPVVVPPPGLAQGAQAPHPGMPPGAQVPPSNLRPVAHAPMLPMGAQAPGLPQLAPPQEHFLQQIRPFMRPEGGGMPQF